MSSTRNENGQATSKHVRMPSIDKKKKLLYHPISNMSRISPSKLMMLLEQGDANTNKDILPKSKFDHLNQDVPIESTLRSVAKQVQLPEVNSR